MIKRPVTPASKTKVKNIEGYFIRIGTKFWSRAKIDCPKEYLGERAYILICMDEE